MPRNWDAEWKVLNAAERKAWHEKEDALGFIIPELAVYGALSKPNVDDFETKNKKWRKIIDEQDEFLRQYREDPRA